jgi:hypothetical protein
MKLDPVTSEPYRTQGHLNVPPFLVTRVSPEARDAYLSLVTDSVLPADAVVVTTHVEAADGGAAGSTGPTYVMERRGGAWRYLVVDERGLIRRQATRDCAGCHAAGVAEGLFGLPRPKTSPPAARE